RSKSLGVGPRMSDVAQFRAPLVARSGNQVNRQKTASLGAAGTISTAVSENIAAKIAGELSALDLFGRLATIRSLFSGRIVFTTSFGLEDQTIAHAIFVQALAIDVATLDTGRLFPETHEVWAETERRYG